jgi:hypothetical protein
MESARARRRALKVLDARREAVAIGFHRITPGLLD